jgi:hypothetical protein
VISVFSRKPILPPKIGESIRSDLVHFVQQGDVDSLRHFSQLCHELITDRDVTFTLNIRTALYRRWLSTGHPVLMAVVHENVPLGASVILPLTKAAYEAFWNSGLDAPDIDVHHLARRRNNKGYRYLLVDVVASEKSFIQNLPHALKVELVGIGLRSMIYHSSVFFNPKAPPIVLCSTTNKKLQAVLTKLGFERGVGAQSDPIFRTDLARQRGWYRPLVQELYDQWRELVRGYRANSGLNS